MDLRERLSTYVWMHVVPHNAVARQVPIKTTPLNPLSSLTLMPKSTGKLIEAILFEGVPENEQVAGREKYSRPQDNETDIS